MFIPNLFIPALSEKIPGVQISKCADYFQPAVKYNSDMEHVTHSLIVFMIIQ